KSSHVAHRGTLRARPWSFRSAARFDCNLPSMPDVLSLDDFAKYVSDELDLDLDSLTRESFDALALDSLQMVELYVAVEDLGCELDLEVMAEATDIVKLYHAYAAARGAVVQGEG